MKYATKKAAKETFEKYKYSTGYIDGEFDLKDMKELFRNMHFGEAETNVIISALVLAGCKFRVD